MTRDRDDFFRQMLHTVCSHVARLRRTLSGYKKLTPTNNTSQLSKVPIEQLKAPEYQMGIKKPDTGILEVETGRIIVRVTSVSS